MPLSFRHLECWWRLWVSVGNAHRWVSKLALLWLCLVPAKLYVAMSRRVSPPMELHVKPICCRMAANSKLACREQQWQAGTGGGWGSVICGRQGQVGWSGGCDRQGQVVSVIRDMQGQVRGGGQAMMCAAVAS
jgi:hypothetical protein